MSRSTASLRIGEVSKLSGVSPRSLRYYEAHELITSRRAPNGYREYDASVVQQASAIRLLFEMGFSRHVVASVLTCIGDVPDAAHQAVEKQLEEVREDITAQIEKLTDTRRQLTAFLDQRASRRTPT